MSPNGIFINAKEKIVFLAPVKLATVTNSLADSEGFHGWQMDFISPHE